MSEQTAREFLERCGVLQPSALQREFEAKSRTSLPLTAYAVLFELLLFEDDSSGHAPASVELLEVSIESGNLFLTALLNDAWRELTAAEQTAFENWWQLVRRETRAVQRTLLREAIGQRRRGRAMQ